ncbi:AEC family transporter [Caballeronia insecticola]|uniref:Auxin Efflux Carrier n=1 Tax=Caballeronia insecticola TaxID=758793 RepID=R4X1E8_9BURK|nr:AEC family transporter [Caballeronia insecticola]BAN26096.1 auxin Efflux Carrier [Caballeronia insecticola]
MHLAGTIFPIFAIIVAGWLAGITGYMPRALGASLTRFAYYVAMPALVFLTIGDEHLHSLLDWRFLAAFGGGSLICFAIAMAFAKIARGARLGSSAMLAASVSMTNTAFVALPVLKALYGKPGVLAAAIATVFVGAFMFPMLVILLEIDRFDASRTIRTGALIRQIATNPVILSTVFGLLWSFGGFGMPAPLESFLTVIGEALTPCALFAIGLELTLGELRERLGFYALLTALKLAVVPLVVYVLCLASGLGHTATVAAVVCAAVPTAKSAYILAVEYDVEKTVVGSVISMSTLFSIVTLLVWLAFI